MPRGGYRGGIPRSINPGRIPEVLQDIESGMNIKEITEKFDVTRPYLKALVLEKFGDQTLKKMQKNGYGGISISGNKQKQKDQPTEAEAQALLTLKARGVGYQRAARELGLRESDVRKWWKNLADHTSPPLDTDDRT